MTLKSLTGNLTHERPENVPAATLLSRLLDDATALVRNELALARTEFLESAKALKSSVTAMAAGAIVLTCGALTLIAAAVLGLSQVVAPWAASLIIGGALTLVGLGMIRTSKDKFADASLKLPETTESLRKDAALAARREP
jgi:Putative Actinobacterial Holin-X, holin superfamily III